MINLEARDLATLQPNNFAVLQYIHPLVPAGQLPFTTEQAWFFTHTINQIDHNLRRLADLPNGLVRWSASPEMLNEREHDVLTQCEQLLEESNTALLYVLYGAIPQALHLQRKLVGYPDRLNRMFPIVASRTSGDKLIQPQIYGSLDLTSLHHSFSSIVILDDGIDGGGVLGAVVQQLTGQQVNTVSLPQVMEKHNLLLAVLMSKNPEFTERLWDVACRGDSPWHQSQRELLKGVLLLPPSAWALGSGFDLGLPGGELLASPYFGLTLNHPRAKYLLSGLDNIKLRIGSSTPGAMSLLDKDNLIRQAVQDISEQAQSYMEKRGYLSRLIG